ncbi:MAG: hypothetical protein SGJ18_08820 [Pseudomonadota bacterium]|nr:hypothetical protein [Pseudomonadota bacterium]
MSKPLKTNPIEQFLYESRPYSLFFIAVYSIKFPENTVMIIAGITLMMCAAIIARLRLKHRGYIKW